MTRGKLLKLLDGEAMKYREEALASIERNRHMNDLSEEDIAKLKENQEWAQRITDALLVDFVNFIGTGQGLDYGLRTKDITMTAKAKMVLHHDDPPCTARLTTHEGGRWCPKCKLHPDMQSTCFYFYCPHCDVRLKKIKCPRCGQVFKSPNLITG